MAIGDLKNKVSRDDVDRVKEIRNPPKYEPGFEPDSGSEFDDIDFSDLFGEDDGDGALFDDLGSGDFGSPSGSGQSGLDVFDSLGSGQSNVFGQSASPFGQGAGLFGQQANQPTKYEPDGLDKAIDASGEAIVNIGKIMIDMFKSIRNRTADDFAYLSRNLIMIGGASLIGSIVLGALGYVGKIRFLSFTGLAGQILGCGGLLIGTGLAGIGFSAIKIANTAQISSGTLDELPDISDMEMEDSTDDYEENIGDILDDLFGDEEEDFFGDEEEDDYGNEESDDVFTPDFGAVEYTAKELDYKEKLDGILENQFISREMLFNTFKGFFPVNTPNFADRKEIPYHSDEFHTIETICLKALANVANCDLEDLDSKLESATESYFSYELRLKRVRRVNKLNDIEREMEAYFRESSSDTSVNATVDIEGDFYKIIITKGETAVVTFGDAFRQQYVCDYFLESKNTLPFILGISELGEVLLADAKIYDTMLIAGKPRSGKSWYVLSIIMSLMMFNSPEEVQFIIVDPKESNLFKTMALMPHVCGLHNDRNILDIMRDIIENEGERRKKLLANNRCDDIWALWKKGIKLPVLYLVIDEIITVKNNLGPLDKEFDALMQTMISQLPSQGIRLIFVPHRATGIVNKTNRTMIAFSAAVRANTTDVMDTLDIKKWTRALTNPGDVAVKTNDRDSGVYVRGATLTTSDEDNAELIENAARAYYKMGVDIPDMTTMQIAFNRDEDYIRKELTGEGRVQYNATNVFNDI